MRIAGGVVYFKDLEKTYAPIELIKSVQCDKDKIHIELTTDRRLVAIYATDETSEFNYRHLLRYFKRKGFTIAIK